MRKARILSTVFVYSAGMLASASYVANAQETTPAHHARHHAEAEKTTAVHHKAAAAASGKGVHDKASHARSGKNADHHSVHSPQSAKHVMAAKPHGQHGHAQHPDHVPDHAHVGPARPPHVVRHVAPPVHVAVPVPSTPTDQPTDGSATPPQDSTTTQPVDKGSNTGLPLPRFAAFRADEVNMRSGPGQRYPIQWVYHRRNMPVEIEREFDVWRLIEDSDGQKGWVHQATLVGNRTFVIPGLPPEGDAAQAGEASEKAGDTIGRADTRIVGSVADSQAASQVKDATILHADASESSATVAVLKPGVVGVIKLCPEGSDWCRVSVKQYSGWLQRKSFWGLLPQEIIQPS